MTPGANGILVAAANVTLDLNGFSISGGAGGGLNGISSGGYGGLAIRNGTVEGFAMTGITVPRGAVSSVNVFQNQIGISGTNCQITDSRVSGNSWRGIDAQACTIESNIILGNAGIGIRGQGVIAHNVIRSNAGGGIELVGLGAGSTVDRNTIEANGVFGISDGMALPPPATPPPPGPAPASGPSTITGNTISGTIFPPGPGIALSQPALIARNLVAGNGGDGIFCATGCSVEGNAVYGNNGAGVGTGGIKVFDGCSVNGNTVSTNMGPGLYLTMSSSYMHNTLYGNTPVVTYLALGHPSSGFQNYCDGAPAPNFSCP